MNLVAHFELMLSGIRDSPIRHRDYIKLYLQRFIDSRIILCFITMPIWICFALYPIARYFVIYSFRISCGTFVPENLLIKYLHSISLTVLSRLRSVSLLLYIFLLCLKLYYSLGFIRSSSFLRSTWQTD